VLCRITNQTKMATPPALLPYNCFIKAQTSSLSYYINAWSRVNDDGCSGNMAMEVFSDFTDYNLKVACLDLRFCKDLGTIYVIDTIDSDFSEFALHYGVWYRLKDDEHMVDDQIIEIAADVLLKQYPAFKKVVVHPKFVDVGYTPSPVFDHIASASASAIKQRALQTFRRVLMSVVGTLDDLNAILTSMSEEKQEIRMFVREAHIDLSLPPYDDCTRKMH